MIPTRSPPAEVARLAALGPPMLGLLVVEFLLGMALALFVALPSGGPAAVLASSPLLWVHIVVGFFLIGITANAVRRSVRIGGRALPGVTVLGLFSAVGAFLAGMAFAFGDQSPVASFAMSVGFTGVLIDAAVLLAWGARAVHIGTGTPAGAPTAEG